MRLTLREIATAVGGRIAVAPVAAVSADVSSDVSAEASVDGVAIDSRLLVPGSLFVPLVAARDGHEFIADAVGRGAAATLTQRPPAELVALGVPLVVVADTAAALTDLGSWCRDRLAGPVIAVTGSVGKTSTKDLCAAAVGAARVVHASERSFNNELGVPLTLANAPAGVEVVVVEMGARGAGHVAALAAVARPTIGVVLCVGAVHTEHFGSIAGVAAAKAELVEALPASGTAVLNADDPLVAAMADRTVAAALTFGAAGEVRAEAVTLDEQLRARFDLVTPWGREPVRLGVRGAHNVINALAAAAAALAADVPLAAVAAGLGQAALSPWRMELVELDSGAFVLNDAYNANPLSMRAALLALAAAPAGRRVAILGPMAELGEGSADAHHQVGDEARALGIEVIAVGVPEYGGCLVPDRTGALKALGSLQRGDVVLLKASRVAGLERLVDALGRSSQATWDQ